MWLKQNSISFSPKLAPFLVLPILVIDLIIHFSSQETSWNSACISIILNSHILLIQSQWYWLVLLSSSLSFHFSFDSHLSFLGDINSTLTHLPVFRLLSLHSLHSQRIVQLQKSHCHSPTKNFSAPQSCFYPLKSFFLIVMERKNFLRHPPEFSMYLHLIYQVLLVCCCHLCPEPNFSWFYFHPFDIHKVKRGNRVDSSSSWSTVQ